MARWLQRFDADALIVDRKTSETIYVPCASVSIAGGIQPAILERSLGQQHRDNGLLARLFIAHTTHTTEYHYAKHRPDYLQEASRALDKLFNIQKRLPAPLLQLSSS